MDILFRKYRKKPQKKSKAARNSARSDSEKERDSGTGSETISRGSGQTTASEKAEAILLTDSGLISEKSLKQISEKRTDSAKKIFPVRTKKADSKRSKRSPAGTVREFLPSPA